MKVDIAPPVFTSVQSQVDDGILLGRKLTRCRLKRPSAAVMF